VGVTTVAAPRPRVSNWGQALLGLAVSTVALGLVGVDPSTAFAFAVTSHLLTTAVVVILGGWALARREATLRALSRQLREALPTSRRSRP
jgi:hypothetical protein